MHDVNPYFDELSDMFADDICLLDWEIRAVGKAAVLLANENIFSSVETIEATPTSLYCENNVVVAELKICIDNKTSILVVDVIEFDFFTKDFLILAFNMVDSCLGLAPIKSKKSELSIP